MRPERQWIIRAEKPEHPSQIRFDAEAELQQHSLEQSVLLEAVAAASADHHLLKQTLGRQIDRSAEQNIGAVVRYGCRVQRVQRT